MKEEDESKKSEVIKMKNENIALSGLRKPERENIQLDTRVLARGSRGEKKRKFDATFARFRPVEL